MYLKNLHRSLLVLGWLTVQFSLFFKWRVDKMQSYMNQ